MLINRARLDAALPAFEIGDPIGRGGYGVVFSARHRRIGWQAAVKVLADGDTDAALRSRFVGEATTLSEIDHPHIVRIHDYVEHDGLSLLIMERLNGPMLHQRPGLTGVEACGAGLAVSDALAAVHARGILHRDVRPENLLYSSDGTLKLVGFGTVSDGASLISAASGPPAYTAPERIQGYRLGPATDVYSLGIVLYELFSGRLPFGRDLPLSALLHHHVNVPPPWLTDVPQPLAAVIDRALSKDANNRQRSGHEFAVELGAAAAGSLGPDWLDQVSVPVRVSGRVRSAAHGALSDVDERALPARASVALPVSAGSATAPVSGAPVSGVPVSGAPVSSAAGGRVVTAPPDPAGVFATGRTDTGTDTRIEPEVTRRARRAFGGSTDESDGFGSGGRNTTVTAAPPDDVPPVDAFGDPYGTDEPRPRAPWYKRGWFLGLSTLLVLGVVGASVLVVIAPWKADSDDDTPAIRTSTPRGLVVDGEGNLYLSDVSNRQVRKVSPSGAITVFAGTGPEVTAGSGGDNGPAVDAQLAFPQSLAIGPQGSLYIADTAEGRVRQVTADGKIRTVVGASPTAEEGDDSSDAQAAELPNFFVIATSRTGRLYIAESGNGTQRVRALDGKGLSVVVENKTEEGGEAGPESEAIQSIRSIAIGSDGRVYVADRGHKLIWGFQPGDATPAAVAGGGTLADCPSKIVQNGPDALAIGDGSELYVGSYGLCELRNGGSARELVKSQYIDAVAAGPNGDVYFLSKNTIYKRTSAGTLTEVKDR